MDRSAATSSPPTDRSSTQRSSVLALDRTPLRLLEHVSQRAGREVWLKHDDRVHLRYGGNKARKLSVLLPLAHAAEATALVTMGAAGSHHALACALHGTAAGFAVHVVLGPQAYTPHAEQTLAATSSLAVVHPEPRSWAIPARSLAVTALLRARGHKPYLLPLGGSTPAGAQAFVTAMRELSEQVNEGAMPAFPSAIFVPVGSGGTFAGLAAGARIVGAPCRVHGVDVTGAPALTALLVQALANRVLAREPHARRAALGRMHAQDFVLERAFSGAGYGIATSEGQRAQELFARDGVVLEPTYTAKTAAALLAHAPRTPRGSRLLFWQTLSSIEPSPASTEFAPALRALLLR